MGRYSLDPFCRQARPEPLHIRRIYPSDLTLTTETQNSRRMGRDICTGWSGVEVHCNLQNLAGVGPLSSAAVAQGVHGHSEAVAWAWAIRAGEFAPAALHWRAHCTRSMATCIHNGTKSAFSVRSLTPKAMQDPAPGSAAAAAAEEEADRLYATISLQLGQGTCKLVRVYNSN